MTWTEYKYGVYVATGVSVAGAFIWFASREYVRPVDLFELFMGTQERADSTRWRSKAEFEKVVPMRLPNYSVSATHQWASNVYSGTNIVSTNWNYYYEIDSYSYHSVTTTCYTSALWRVPTIQLTELVQVETGDRYIWNAYSNLTVQGYPNCVYTGVYALVGSKYMRFGDFSAPTYGYSNTQNSQYWLFDTGPRSGKMTRWEAWAESELDTPSAHNYYNIRGFQTANPGGAYITQVSTNFSWDEDDSVTLNNTRALTPRNESPIKGFWYSTSYNTNYYVTNIVAEGFSSNLIRWAYVYDYQTPTNSCWMYTNYLPKPYWNIFNSYSSYAQWDIVTAFSKLLLASKSQTDTFCIWSLPYIEYYRTIGSADYPFLAYLFVDTNEAPSGEFTNVEDWVDVCLVDTNVWDEYNWPITNETLVANYPVYTDEVQGASMDWWEFKAWHASPYISKSRLKDRYKILNRCRWMLAEGSVFNRLEDTNQLTQFELPIGVGMVYTSYAGVYGTHKTGAGDTWVNAKNDAEANIVVDTGGAVNRSLTYGFEDVSGTDTVFSATYYSGYMDWKWEYSDATVPTNVDSWSITMNGFGYYGYDKDVYDLDKMSNYTFNAFAEDINEFPQPTLVVSNISITSATNYYSGFTFGCTNVPSDVNLSPEWCAEPSVATGGRADGWDLAAGQRAYAIYDWNPPACFNKYYYYGVSYESWNQAKINATNNLLRVYQTNDLEQFAFWSKGTYDNSLYDVWHTNGYNGLYVAEITITRLDFTLEYPDDSSISLSTNLGKTVDVYIAPMTNSPFGDFSLAEWDDNGFGIGTQYWKKVCSRYFPAGDTNVYIGSIGSVTSFPAWCAEPSVGTNTIRGCSYNFDDGGGEPVYVIKWDYEYCTNDI